MMMPPGKFDVSLSSITCCPQTVVRGGQNIGVSYAAADRFYLDGQRLVVYNDPYGNLGSLYHTEIEGFSNVEAYGTAGPAYFTTQTKSGQTLELRTLAELALRAARGSRRLRRYSLVRSSFERRMS